MPFFFLEYNMSGNILPTLSTDGWVNELAMKADRIMSYFFISDFSQTELYPDKITSLPYIIKVNAGDEMLLKSEMTRALNAYLSRHFDKADVSVSTNITSDTDHRLEIKLIITVYENDVQYNLGRLIQTVNSTISSIVNINN